MKMITTRELLHKNSEIRTRYFLVPRIGGQQLKDQAQLDGWLRDGSANAIAALCDFGEGRG